jgi:hypothetical protein
LGENGLGVDLALFGYREPACGLGAVERVRAVGHKLEISGKNPEFPRIAGAGALKNGRKDALPQFGNRVEGREAVSSRTFEAVSACLRIESYAFASCSSLSSICIPSSVETLCDHCFSQCTALSSVTFEPGSRLSHIEAHAFAHCSSLPSLCIPSSVWMLRNTCFFACKSLPNVTFEPGSKLSSVPRKCWRP